MTAVSRVLFVAMLLGGTSSVAFAQAPPPILQEPQTIRLWEGKAPGALGDAPDDVPTLTIYMPPNTTGPMTAVIVAPRRRVSRAVDEQGRPHSREPAERARHRGVRAGGTASVRSIGIPSSLETCSVRFASSDRVRPSGTSHPTRSGSWDFGRRPPRIDCVHAVRSRPRRRGRCDRSGRQSPRFRDPRLSGDHAFRGVDASGIENDASRRERRGRRAQSFDRHARLTRHAAHVSVPHERRYGCPCGKQRLLFSRPPEGRRTGRNAYLQGWPGVGMPMNDTSSEWPKVLANWMRASGFL